MYQKEIYKEEKNIFDTIGAILVFSIFIPVLLIGLCGAGMLCVEFGKFVFGGPTQVEKFFSFAPPIYPVPAKIVGNRGFISIDLDSGRPTSPLHLLNIFEREHPEIKIIRWQVNSYPQTGQAYAIWFDFEPRTK